MNHLTLSLCFLIAIPVSGQADTHRYTPTSYVKTFSYAHPPVLRIKPGNKVITTTVDTAGFNHNGNLITSPGNPQTGPFYIEGAEVGDTLVVTLEKIKPNRRLGISLDLIAPYALEATTSAHEVAPVSMSSVAPHT